MTPTLRLEGCGDFLTMRQYCQWRGESATTVYKQIARGNVFVEPATLKPLRWRRSDCEKAMAQADVIRERQQRARLRIVSATGGM